MEPPITLLLIEDNPGDARLIEIMVREIDQPAFALDWADCLSAAWQRLAQNKYQGILLDLHLPDSQGINTFEEVAQRAPDLPVVVLTGMDDLQLAIQLVREGAQDYLVKGQISSTLLSKAIQYAIERKRTAESLRESEERLQRAINATQDGIWEWDIETNREFFSPRWCEILGYSFDDPALPHTYNAWASRIHPDDHDRVIEAQRSHLEHGSKYDVDYRHRHKSGEYRWQNSRGLAVLNEQGKPIKMVGCISDITDRKLAEESLKKERNRLYEVLETLPAMICLLTPDYHVAFANRSFRERFGDAHGRHCYEYCFGSTEPCEFCEAYDVLKTGKPHHWEVTTPDGCNIIDAYDFPFSDIDGSPLILEMDIDITERKLAEEALRNREGMLQRIFDILPVGLWFADKDGTLLRGNPAGVKIWGAEPKVGPSEYGVFKARHLPSGEEVAPDDWALAHTIRDRATIVDELLEIDAFDGKKKTILNYTAPVLDAQGDVQGAIVVNQDITERKKAEEELRESEEKYRALVENANEVILVAQDGMLKFVNRAASELTGYSEQELTSRPFPEFVHPDDRGMVVESYQKRFKGDAFQPKYAFRIVTRDSGITWVEIGAVLIDWEGRPATLNFLTDITERKRVEEILLREQTMLARTEGIAQIGSWEWDIATDTVAWSDELFRIFQRDPREGAPSFAEHPAFYHPDDMARLQQAVEVAVTLGTPYELELRAIRKDGETRVCMARGVAEMGPGGRAVHLFGSLQDITERKHLELETAKARADFLFAVSHELKTPLLVLGTTQEMVEALPEEQRVERFRAYETIWKRNLVRLRHIIENLVDSQRPPGMGSKLEKQLISLAGTVTEVIADLEPIAFAKEVTLTLKAEPLPDLPLDPHAWTRLVENLLTNAIKFSHTGGEVTLRIRRAVGNVEMAVIDHGIGISPQALPFLFGLFYRSPEALQAGVQGTGLGLYVVKLIAEAHGGSVEVESEVGKGTTITVRLPLPEAIGS